MFLQVNVLDEQYNPGLREAIKKYSEWPTIPQVAPVLPFVSLQQRRLETLDMRPV